MDSSESKREKRRRRAAMNLAESRTERDDFSGGRKTQAKNEENDELEIDLERRVPLSKKQQRLLKKGKRT